MKRFLSVLLALAIIMSCVPAMPIFAKAAVEQQSAFEDYTPISSKEELDAIRNDLNGKYYLTEDIVFTSADFSGSGNFYNGGSYWIPIGTSSAPFKGVLDGNGHTISGLKIAIRNSSESYAGLFGCINSSSSGYGVFNLGMLDCNIIVSNATGTGYAGAIAGYCETGTIEGCYSNGYVFASATSGTAYTGGIVGYKQYGSINRCYNLGSVAGAETIGGIVGGTTYAGISNCFAKGDRYGKYAGGISGSSSFGSIENCYTLGDAESTYGTGFAGGIVGMNSNCTVANCYYTSNTSSGGGTKKTASAMQTQSTFSVFDFTNIWTMDGNAEYFYPELLGINTHYVRTLTSISVSTMPTKTTYLQNEEALDISGGVITLHYDEGPTSTISMTTEMVSGFDNSILGQQTLTISYGGKTTTVDIKIIEPVIVSSLSITKLPTKKKYVQNKENLDVTGGIITLVYNDGTITRIMMTPEMVTGFDNTVLGEQELTVTYGDKRATFFVHVIETAALSGISVNTLPNKLKYIRDEENLDVTGGIITLTYSDGTTTILPMTLDMITGFDNTASRQQLLTVSYGGKTTTFAITVYKPIAFSQNLTYSLSEDGVLTISGNGAMEDYASASESPWYSQRATIQKIIIKDGVTTIGARAFYGCTALKELQLGKDVTSIGTYAFRGCSLLTEVTIPSGVVQIDGSAFRECSVLALVYFEGDAPVMGDYVFTGCAASLAIKYYEDASGFDVAPWTDYTALTLHKGEWVVDTEATCTTEGSRHFTCSICGATETETIPFSHHYEDHFCLLCGALEIIASGFCGSETNWLLDGLGELHIDGTGAINSYSNGAAPWYAYRDQIKTITISDSITSIGSSAFNGCSSLESMTIPFVGGSEKTASNTYQYPFGFIFGTSSYTGGVATSQSYCGSSTSSTTSSTYYIPSSLKSVTVTGGNILYGAFYNCDNLTSITIPDGITSIGRYAFYNCSSLSTIAIPDSVTSIGVSAFYNCSSLTSIIIPESIISIGNSAFYNCSSLTAITIPDSVTSIGNYTFYNCSSLTAITIPDSVTSIGSSAFSGCSGLTSITIPEKVTSIGEYAFSSCSSLTSITIPEKVTSIDGCAFGYCSSLTTLNFNATNCTKMGFSDSFLYYSAFRGCANLTTVNIGNNVIKIPSRAFYDCSSLTSVYITDLAAWSMISFGDSYANPLFYAGELYLNGELVTELVIPDSVTSIGKYAFSGCSGLTSITIPESVTNIGDGAFYNCSSLTSITIPDSITSISYSAFSGCSGLTSITIPESVTSIGSSAFSGCSSLTGITIPESVTSIGSSAFSGCSSLESMTIPFVGESRKTASDTYQYPFGYIFGTSSYTGGVATTQYYYGSSTSSTTSSTYYIPSSLKSVTVTGGNILYGAFEECSSLTAITIGYGVTGIGERAFYNCRSLTGITIPEKVTSIGECAFYGCSSLTGIWVDENNAKYSSDEMGVLFNKNKTQLIQAPSGSTGIYTIPDSVTSIGDDAFSYCSSLTAITIPNSVTSIGSYAFSECSGLTSITIPESVTSVGFAAFEECSSLTSATIGSGVTIIGWFAFSYCSSLTAITIPDSVTSIGYGAFFGCSSLKHVAYTGTQSRWSSISIDSNNTMLADAIRHYETHLEDIDNCMEKGIYCPVCKEFISRIVKENGAHSYMDELDVNCDACGYVRVVTAFSISQLPVKLGYQLFEELDVTGGVLSVTFDDGNVVTAPMTKEMVTGFDASLIGRQQLTVTYGAETAFFTVEVVAQMPDSLELLTKPDQLSYLVGEMVDLSGLTLKAWYGEEEAVVTAADVSVRADLTSAGVKTATVTFQGLAVTFEIYVHEGGWKTLDSSLYPQSNHSYSNNLNETKTFTYPGALSLKITFNSSTSTESNYDFIYVYDGNGTQIAKYTGTAAANQTLTIPGDRFQVKLTSDGSQTKYGYAFSSIQADVIEHPEVVVPGYAATCTQTGLTDGATCEICGETVVTQTEIPMLDHDWAAATCVLPQTCTMCSGTQGEPLGHSGTWMTLIAPTETLGGIKARICDVCGDTESAIMPPEVHHWSAWVTVKQPTCYETGIQMRACLCGAKESRILPTTHTGANGICIECGQLESYAWKLSASATVQLSLTEDLYIDLSGYDLSGTIITNGFKVYGKDSATDAYTCENIGYFTCVDEKGNFIVPERIYTEGEKQYMAICVEDRYSFHRFFVGITHMSLEPEVVGLGYKAAIFGDEMVFAELAETNAFTFHVQLQGYNPVYRYFDSSELASGDSIALRIRNYDVERFSEHNLYAQVCLTLKDGTIVETEQVSLTFRWLTEQVNANHTDYTADQLASFAAMLQKFTIVKEWDIPNLLQTTKDKKAF